MNMHLIAVGNSKGLRLPKAILAQCGIEDCVSLKMTENGLLISPVRSYRQGWEERILAEHQEAGQGGPECASTVDQALQPFTEVANAFDTEEWTWPDKAR